MFFTKVFLETQNGSSSLWKPLLELLSVKVFFFFFMWNKILKKWDLFNVDFKDRDSLLPQILEAFWNNMPQTWRKPPQYCSSFVNQKNQVSITNHLSLWIGKIINVETFFFRGGLSYYVLIKEDKPFFSLYHTLMNYSY